MKQSAMEWQYVVQLDSGVKLPLKDIKSVSSPTHAGEPLEAAMRVQTNDGTMFWTRGLRYRWEAVLEDTSKPHRCPHCGGRF